MFNNKKMLDILGILCALGSAGLALFSTIVSNRKQKLDIQDAVAEYMKNNK